MMLTVVLLTQLILSRSSATRDGTVALPAHQDQPVTRGWRPPIRYVMTQVSTFPTFNKPQCVHCSLVRAGKAVQR